jgi:hypothetical protein
VSRLACALAFAPALVAGAPQRADAQAPAAAVWETWTPVKLTSAGGATLAQQGDGSILVSGANPDKDTLTLEFSLEKNGWNGIRVEALADASLPGGGPGRSTNGNFVLSEVKLAAAPRNSVGLKPVALERPSADFEQIGLGATMATDAAPSTGWAIWPNVGKNHEWIAQLARPLGFDGGVKATLTLEFQHGGQHALGRFRVSGSTSPLPLKAVATDASFGDVAGRIPGAMDAGIGWLLDRQLLDGSWSYKQPEFRHGTTALVAYTLLKSGVRKDHPAVLRAFAFMDAQLPNKTYEAGLELMARGALDDERQTPRMEEIVARMLAWQSGGWSYPTGNVDLSNTQYAAMGLRSAALHGVKIPATVWTKLGDEVLTHQQTAVGAYEPAGFGYGPKSNPYGSMTAAGTAVLRICVEQLEKVGKPPVAYSTAYKRGISWIGKHFLASGNPLAGPEWTIYWLYSVERVGGLCGITEFEGHDWYREGAKYLIPVQAATGQWEGHDGPTSHTCFALLFLARATAPASGLASRGPNLYGGDDLKAPASLRASGDTPLTLWVSSFGAAEQAMFEWPQDHGAGLRVSRVDYVLPGRALLGPARDDPGHWYFATEPPTAGWERPDFDPEAAKWRSGPGAFGLPGSAGTAVRTEWREDQLWMRRTFEIDDAPLVDPQLLVHHASALPVRAGALETAPLVCLFDEEADFAAQLTERPEKSTANVQEKDAANGRRCLAVTPLQSFSANLRGWNYPIAEKPQPGEFRFLRLAWRKEGGGGIMVQFAFNGAFDGRTRRVYSGPNEVGWPGALVEKESPKSWKVVTVDLWKELGGAGVLTGMAFTPMKAGVAYFDAIWLARGEADFKAVPKSGVPERADPPDAASGSAPPAATATGEGPRLEIWVNGTRAWAGDDEYADYSAVATCAPLASLLHPGTNVVAVACRRRGPGQSVDVAIADQRVLARIEGRPDAASRSERWPAQVTFEKNGTYVVRARAHVRVPPAEDAAPDAATIEQLVESAPLTVRIREAPDPELLSFAQDPERNLVAQVGATVTASSFRDAGWAPHLVADNFQSHGWLSADGDPRPALAIALNKPVRADTVLVSPLGDWLKQSNPELAARVRRVEVAIDGGKGGTFELVLPEDGRKGVLRLARPTVIRRLDLKVLDAEGGAERKNGVGLAEVELQISNRK